MLYDRALLDLARAEDAQTAGDWGAASSHLTHAQDVIAELSSSLDLEVWPGAKDLLAIYGYLSDPTDRRERAARRHGDARVRRTPRPAALGVARGRRLVAAPDGATEQSIAVVA